METRSKRKRTDSARQGHSATPRPNPTPPLPTDASTDSRSPSPNDHKRRRSNRPPRPPSTVPSISSVEPASQNTWQNRKNLAEARIDEYKVAGRPKDDLLAKTLKAILDYLPEGGRDQLASDIIGVGDDDPILWEVFDNFRTGVLEAFKSTTKTFSVTPSPHHNRRASIDKVAAKLPDPQVRSQEWANACLNRDNHRCVITGAVTESEWIEQGEVGGQLWGKLEVHHIIPFSLGGFDKKDHHDIAVKWASIYNAFPAIKKMQASKINMIENGITLLSQIHSQFQAFKIALQPTETANFYKVKKYKSLDPFIFRVIPDDASVTLRQSTGHENKSLPNRDFLDTHFRLCEIWHASGMAEEHDRHLY
ncbi:hypothetical protein NUU61_003039 [Penicillium alfredii]|uniref:HNH nuclease domain-containing protein n=1 Tax=Penicillium alfredii TaxID=1506179 RepID=A0A9W9KHT3_9EURO|nr:uncharacterized protein NUU61_003039 [Penicillium alfredii]KAJ5105692.1 hypothetical protein NUU61_003039 [Penicillium alfredii]